VHLAFVVAVGLAFSLTFTGNVSLDCQEHATRA